MEDWSKADLSKADTDLVEKVIRDSEIQLASMVQLATSADQRASILAGIYVAAATAMSAGLVALISRNAPSVPILVGGGASVLVFLIAAGFCTFAAMPVSFWLPGAMPSAWRGALETQRPLPDVLWGQITEYEKKGQQNRETVNRQARRLKFGAWLGVLAPAVGFIIFGLIQLGRLLLAMAHSCPSV